MLLLLVVSCGSLKVQAAYNKNLTDELKTRTIRVDLNKDGKKETVRVEYPDKQLLYGYDLYINGRLLLKDFYGLWILDINTNDKYIEIAVYDTVRLRIYRYNGKKLTAYVSALEGLNFSDQLKKNQFYSSAELDIKTAGNGSITIYNTITIPSTINNMGTFYGSCRYGLNYIVKKKSMRYNAKEICKVTMPDEKTLKMTKKWNAYKYPRLKPNKKMFTVKKGDVIKITNLKITPAYSYMKITNVKLRRSGWVIFRTRDIT